MKHKYARSWQISKVAIMIKTQGQGVKSVKYGTDNVIFSNTQQRRKITVLSDY
jgi:hypothetical protein